MSNNIHVIEEVKTELNVLTLSLGLEWGHSLGHDPPLLSLLSLLLSRQLLLRLLHQQVLHTQHNTQ